MVSVVQRVWGRWCQRCRECGEDGVRGVESGGSTTDNTFPHFLHLWHHLPHTLCTTDTIFSPHRHQISLYYGCSSCFHWLLTDDDAVHRNVSIRYYKIKIIPPVSLLQTQLTMRVISTRSFGSLKTTVNSQVYWPTLFCLFPANHNLIGFLS